MNEKICGSSPQASKEPQVTKELEHLSHSLGSLEELVANLNNNLNVVLRQPNPQCEKKNNVDSEIVPLAHEIRISGRRVHIINESIKDILGRLEV